MPVPNPVHPFIQDAHFIAPRGAKAYILPNQSVPRLVWTVIQLNQEVFDDLGEFNVATYQFTAKATGRYLLAFGFDVSNAVAGEYYQAMVQKTGDVNLGMLNQISDGTRVSACGATVSLINAGDVVKFWIYHDGAANRTLENGEFATFLAIMRIK